MNETLQQILNPNLNVQVPLATVGLVLAVALTAAVLIRKAIGLALALAAKVSFGMLAAAALFVGGLAGSGHSIGTLASGPPSPPSDKEYRLTSQQLLLIADKANTGPVLDYARERDRQFVSTQAISTVDAGGVPEDRNYSWTFSALIASVGLVLVGVMWFIRAS